MCVYVSAPVCVCMCLRLCVCVYACTYVRMFASVPLVQNIILLRMQSHIHTYITHLQQAKKRKLDPVSASTSFSFSAAPHSALPAANMNAAAASSGVSSSSLQAPSPLYIEVNNVRYSIVDCGTRMRNADGKFVDNTCCYNVSYSCLTGAELEEWPTPWSWRCAVLAALTKGRVKGWFIQALDDGFDVYNTRSFDEYVQYMTDNNAMGGPLEFWAAAFLLKRAFRIVVRSGQNVVVHPIMGGDGKAYNSDEAVANGLTYATVLLSNIHWQKLVPVAKTEFKHDDNDKDCVEVLAVNPDF